MTKLRCGGNHNEGSFTRWQAVTIAQLGYAVGLYLSFSTAALGWLLSLINSQSYNPDTWTVRFMDGAGVGLIASLVLGGFCVVNRLHDFRLTTRIAREREQSATEGLSAEQIRANLAELRARTAKLGRRTWLLFAWQIGTFAIASLSLVVGFALMNQTRLL